MALRGNVFCQIIKMLLTFHVIISLLSHASQPTHVHFTSDLTVLVIQKKPLKFTANRKRLLDGMEKKTKCCILIYSET